MPITEFRDRTNVKTVQIVSNNFRTQADIVLWQRQSRPFELRRGYIISRGFLGIPSGNKIFALNKNADWLNPAITSTVRVTSYYPQVRSNAFIIDRTGNKWILRAGSTRRHLLRVDDGKVLLSDTRMIYNGDRLQKAGEIHGGHIVGDVTPLVLITLWMLTYGAGYVASAKYKSLIQGLITAHSNEEAEDAKEE